MNKKYLLPLANFLCLIHCVGMGLISASAPLILASWHLEWLEYVLLAFNLIVGHHIFKSLKTPTPYLYALYLGIGISFIGLILDYHGLYHTCLSFTAVGQIYTLIKFHNQRHHNHQCCEDHHH